MIVLVSSMRLERPVPTFFVCHIIKINKVYDCNLGAKQTFFCQFIKKMAKKFVVSRKMCNFAALNNKKRMDMYNLNNNTWWWRNSRFK